MEFIQFVFFYRIWFLSRFLKKRAPKYSPSNDPPPSNKSGNIKFIKLIPQRCNLSVFVSYIECALNRSSREVLTSNVNYLRSKSKGKETMTMLQFSVWKCICYVVGFRLLNLTS